jgi:hypothetical protein
MNTVAQKANKEILTTTQRWLEFAVVTVMLLLLGFLLYHQSANTGFFTAKFGTLEMVCLYAPILLSVTAPVVRAFTGHRNPARPYEAATSLVLALGSLWLLIVFPFNFSHLADTLPSGIRFLLAWFPDDLGKVLLLLQAILGPLSAALTGWRYFAANRRETGVQF